MEKVLKYPPTEDENKNEMKASTGVGRRNQLGVWVALFFVVACCGLLFIYTKEFSVTLTLAAVTRCVGFAILLYHMARNGRCALTKSPSLTPISCPISNPNPTRIQRTLHLGQRHGGVLENAANVPADLRVPPHVNPETSGLPAHRQERRLDVPRRRDVLPPVRGRRHGRHGRTPRADLRRASRRLWQHPRARRRLVRVPVPRAGRVLPPDA